MPVASISRQWRLRKVTSRSPFVWPATTDAVAGRVESVLRLGGGEVDFEHHVLIEREHRADLRRGDVEIGHVERGGGAASDAVAILSDGRAPGDELGNAM